MPGRLQDKVSAEGSGIGDGQGSSIHHGKGGDQNQRHTHDMYRDIGRVVMIGTILCKRPGLVAARAYLAAAWVGEGRMGLRR